MTNAGTCSQCGAALPASAPGNRCPKCLLQFAFDPAAAETDLPQDSALRIQQSAFVRVHYFGDYELLEEIARGGMGVVWKARQVSLNRTVAVKLLLAGKFSSPDFVKRFRAEAEAAANLQHPNIVAIHEVGEHEGQHYFSMDYVEGQNLARLVGDKPLPARRAAAYLNTIAEAVHYAHRRGVLHRDLKPSNVLIDASDQPRVTDFGLAKRLQPLTPALSPSEGAREKVYRAEQSERVDSSSAANSPPSPGGEGRGEGGRSSESQSKSDQSLLTSAATEDLTLTGQVLGTPGYMPPEQAAGKRREMGVTSDVYSLGAILFYLLTARPPFQAETLEATLRQVTDTEPISPRLLNPDLSRDLETICLKCLSKEPRRRYDSAQTLAEDLQRWLNHEPIHARPVSAPEKFWRWCRRKPALATSLATVLLLLLAIAIGASAMALRISRAKDQLAKAQHETTTNLWDSLLAQARGTRLSGRPGRRFESLAALAKAAAIRPSAELRDEAIAALALFDVRMIRRAINFTPDQIRPAFDANLERYAINMPSGEISVRQTSDDREILRLPAGEQKPHTIVRYSPSGRLLAVRYEDGSLKVWDLESQHDVFTGKCADDSSGMGADFAPDERHLALVNGRREITIHDLTTGGQLHSWPVPMSVTRVRYSPNGKMLAVAAGGSPLAVVDAVSGTTIVYWPKAAAYWFAWHPDGRLLAIAGADRQIHLWDVREDKEVRVLPGHPSGDFGELAFSASDDMLVSTSWDGTSIWNYRTGERLLAWSDALYHLQVAADGRRMVRRKHQRADFELSEIASGSPVATYGSKTHHGHQDPDNMRSASFSPDGNLLAFACGRLLRVLDPRTRLELAAASIAPAESVAFDGQTNLWLSGSRGLWRLPARLDRTEAIPQFGPPEPVGPAAATGRMVVSLDGRTLAAICGQHCLVFDTLTGEQLARTSRQPRDLQFLALNRDGHLLATAAWADSSLRFWDARTGNPRPLPDVPELRVPHCDMFFSPDGKSLATASGYVCSLWSVENWQLRWAVPREDFTMVAFSPDSRWVAHREARKLVGLLSAETGRRVARLEAPFENYVGGFAFSPDSTRLAAWGDITDELFVWDLPSLRQHLAAMGLDWEQRPFRAAERAPSPSLQVRIIEDSPECLQRTHAAVASLIPPRDPQADLSLIDLTAHFNLALTQSWFPLAPSRENTFAELPQGVVRLAGVDFDVRGGVQLSGTDPKKRDYPRRVTGLRVGRACRGLHALHGTRVWEAEGTRIGRYVIHYADGRQGEWPIVYGQNVRDFWKKAAEPETPAGLVEAWTGHNADATANGATLRLFKASWKNPRTEVPIESIDFESDLTKCEPFLIALTAEL